MPVFMGAQPPEGPLCRTFFRARQAGRGIALFSEIERLFSCRPGRVMVRGGLNWCGSVF